MRVILNWWTYREANRQFSKKIWFINQANEMTCFNVDIPLNTKIDLGSSNIVYKETCRSVDRT